MGNVLPPGQPVPDQWAITLEQLDAQIARRRANERKKGKRIPLILQPTTYGEYLLARMAERGWSFVTLGLAAGVDPLRIWEFIYGFTPSPSFSWAELGAIERQLRAISEHPERPYLKR